MNSIITVSFLKISSWEIGHFPWSWSDHINLNFHLGTNICHKSPTQTVFWPFCKQYLFINVNVTPAVFVAAIIGNDWQPSWILVRLLRNNLCKNVFMKVSYPQEQIHVLKGNYHKKMTIKIRDMEIPILVSVPLLWPNHFTVLNCVVLA